MTVGNKDDLKKTPSRWLYNCIGMQWIQIHMIKVYQKLSLCWWQSGEYNSAITRLRLFIKRQNHIYGVYGEFFNQWSGCNEIPNEISQHGMAKEAVFEIMNGHRTPLSKIMFDNINQLFISFLLLFCLVTNCFYVQDKKWGCLSRYIKL